METKEDGVVKAVILGFYLGFTLDSKLDTYDRKLIAALQEDARLSFAELGRRVHLSAPAVAERIKRMEEGGVLLGYRPIVNIRALGYSLEALVNVTVSSHTALDTWAMQHLEVLAIHATTGTYCASLRIAVREPEHLQSLLVSLGELGSTVTSLVLSSQLEHRALPPADQLWPMPGKT